MAEEHDQDQPRKASGLLRKLGIGIVCLLVLLLAAYFVVTSSAFVKSVILPRVGKSLNAEITVADASLSPFSQVTLNKLKVQTTGTEPLLTAEQVRLRYRLFSMLRGNYVVDELTLASPTIQIIKDTNGTSNLDPLTQRKEGRAAPEKTTEPVRLALRNVSLKDATLRTTTKAKDGSSSTTQLSQLDLNLDRVENGQAGKMTLSAALSLENRPAAGQGTNDLLQGKADGTFNFKLDRRLLPETLTGNARVDFPRGEGAYADLAQLRATLDAEVTPTEMRQLALRFERAGQGLGRIQASGPLDLTNSVGRLKVEIQSLDRQVLNLYGARQGWDFANSTLNATNSIDIRKDVIAKGQVVGRQLGIKRQGLSTPPLDLNLDYEVTVDLAKQTVTISKLTLAAVQQQKEFLSASLDRPMVVTWGPNPTGYKDSTLSLKLTQMNLAEWQPLVTNLTSGRLDLQLSLTATNDAKLLLLTNTATLQDFSARFGSNRIDQARIALDIKGSLDDFKALTLSQYQLQVQQGNQPLLKTDGSARYDLSKGDLNLQANGELGLPLLLRQFPVSQLTASNGTVRLSSALIRKGQKYSATGNILVADFTGQGGGLSLEDIQAGLDYNLDFQQPIIQVHSATLALRKGYSAGGTVSVTGSYDLSKSSAQLTYKLVDLNQNALTPVLAPLLGDKKIVSISLSGSGSTSYDPKGEAALKTDLTLTNWVVADAKSKAVSPTLGASVQLDGSMKQQILELRQAVLKLTPTTNGANELTIKGRLDLNTNATPSQLNLQAQSLDLTPYYNLFGGGNTTNPPAARPALAPRSVGTPASASPAEPTPIKLPIEKLAADLKVDRLCLREVVISNLLAAANVNGSQLTLKPMQLAMANSGSLAASADLNLGVPGYAYDVSFEAKAVPTGPLGNSFTTNAPGQYKGELFAQAQFKGAGITDANLKKNLNGKLSFSLTNMNYEIVAAKTKRLIEPIALVLRLPQLTQTPINSIGARTEVGKGQIDLQQFTVQSQAFYAETHGVIPMAEPLTNSPLNLPVSLSLHRSLADTARLTPANSPTNTAYVQLPTFVMLTGTLGDSKTEISKGVVAGMLAGSVGRILPVGEKAGTILQGVGSFLTGQKGVNTNAPAGTNAAANIAQGLNSLLGQKQTGTSTNSPDTTNANSPSRIVQGVGGLLNQFKKDSPGTNAPPATNKPPQSSPLGDLLKLIPEKK